MIKEQKRRNAMVTMDEVMDQLKAIGVEFRLWGRAELRELRHILVPGERIMHCLNGRYEGGFAVLCATDRRLLLIDKKPFYLTLEDLRYDMISEIDFSHRLLDATVRVCTVNKTLRFTSMKNQPLRKLTAYTQDRIMEIRQHQSQPQPVMQNYQDMDGVSQFHHRIINPYTKVPLLMRRRVGRFYSS
jgi:hypothetical protein